MWKPYLNVIASEAGQALHVLDRFHITTHLNQAVDQVRRAESTRLRAVSQQQAQKLKHMRWPLLRRGTGFRTARTERGRAPGFLPHCRPQSSYRTPRSGMQLLGSFLPIHR
jgi:hypothetical protein